MPENKFLMVLKKSLISEGTLYKYSAGQNYKTPFKIYVTLYSDYYCANNYKNDNFNWIVKIFVPNKNKNIS